MIIDSFCLHTPIEEERTTMESILVPGASMKLLPTHCINASGELEGFQLSLPSDAKGGVLPINRVMFHGTALFEVTQTERGGLFNADVMRLQQSDARESMRALMHQIANEAQGHEASFRCVPDNVDLMASVRSEGSAIETGQIARTTGRRSVDFASWSPELPHSIGLYQSFCRGYQKDQRVHKLFIGVSGGLGRCSDEFYNLLLDVGNEFDCKDVANSEEVREWKIHALSHPLTVLSQVWWLRKACQRARAKLALRTAKHFGLTIPTAKDLFSYDQDEIGVALTDTIEYDIKDGPNNSVEFYSACVDTTAIQNGILTRMHESEVSVM